MSNLLLILDPASETKKVTKTDKCGKQTCEFVTETHPPLDCKEGEKMILFVKDPSNLVASANGLIVADIIYRRIEAGKYHYYLQYDDAILDGIAPDTLQQCDILKACCYDCAAEYADTRDEIVGAGFVLVGDVGAPEDVDPGDTVTVAGGSAAESVVTNPDTVTINVQISTDANNALTFGGDGGLYATAGGGGVVDCNDTRACINTADLLLGAGTPGDPYRVSISTDPGNIAAAGTDTGIFVPDPGTDAMLDTGSNYGAGSNQLRHTSLDAVVFEFAEGFRTNRERAGCGDPGTHATKMVREISIDNGELVVDAAPEHLARALTFVFNNAAVAINIEALGNYASAISNQFVFANPSACRVFEGLLHIGFNAAVALADLGVFRYTGRLQVDGGGFTDIVQTQWGTYPGLTGTNWFMSAKIPFTIPANGSIIFEFQHVIDTLIASNPGSIWNQFSTDIGAQGSTI